MSKKKLKKEVKLLKEEFRKLNEIFETQSLLLEDSGIIPPGGTKKPPVIQP